MSAAVRQARSQSIGDLLRRSARRDGAKLAVVDGDCRFTFDELDRVVNRVANALAARGVRHGDRVALVAHNSWHYVAISYAMARLGAILVPINFMLGPAEIAYILDHSGSRGLIVEEALAAVGDEALALSTAPVELRAVIGVDDAGRWEPVEAWTEHDDETAPAIVVADDDPLRLMYTSGTESRPKGAIHSSRTLIAQYVSCIVGGQMTADDVDVHSMPMYHCAQLDCFLGPDIYLGATSIILPGPEPELVLRTLQEHRATRYFAPPTVWISLMRSPAFETTDLSALVKGYYGASPMPVEVLGEMQRRMPQLRLWNFYGQTELAPLATILPPDEQASHPGSAGRPVLNVETRVVDDDGRELPAGEVGEIVHRSPQAMLGYWRDDEKTAAAFRGGWFHSGDLGVFDAEGRLSVVDRKKDMIKTGGENVASREVEEVLYLSDAIVEAAVFGVPDPHWIERVTAAVVPRPGVALTAEDVIAHCRAHLAGYKTPKDVFLLESLPKNPSGKILKRELRERFTESMEERVG
jgi:fatty-acyl-CoA synthase